MTPLGACSKTSNRPPTLPSPRPTALFNHEPRFVHRFEFDSQTKGWHLLRGSTAPVERQHLLRGTSGTSSRVRLSNKRVAPLERQHLLLRRGTSGSVSKSLTHSGSLRRSLFSRRRRLVGGRPRTTRCPPPRRGSVIRPALAGEGTRARRRWRPHVFAGRVPRSR